MHITLEIVALCLTTEIITNSMDRLLEFVLFVRACIETDRRNKAASAAIRTVYMVPTGGYYTPLGGLPQPGQQYTPMPQPPPNTALAPHQQWQSGDPIVYGYYAPSGGNGWPQQQQQQPQLQQASPQPTRSTPASPAPAELSMIQEESNYEAGPSHNRPTESPGTAL